MSQCSRSWKMDPLSHSNKMVGWEQISHLFVDSDHNNLQFWILKPPVNLPARYSWCGMGAQIRHSSCLWLFAQSIEIQKSIWKSYWNHYMILDAKNIQELSHLPPFSIFGPRLVPQMAIFPMAFGAFSPTMNDEISSVARWKSCSNRCCLRMAWAPRSQRNHLWMCHNFNTHFP